MLRCCICAVSILVMGCSTSTWERNPSRDYNIWISDNFNQEHQQDIEQAVATWQNALGNYLVLTLVPNGQENISVVPTTVQDLSKSRNDSDNTTIGWCQHLGVGSKIHLAVNLTEEDFRWTARHEIGHALGLQHSVRNTVMCESNTCASKEITVSDIVQLYQVWTSER